MIISEVEQVFFLFIGRLNMLFFFCLLQKALSFYFSTMQRAKLDFTLHGIARGKAFSIRIASCPLLSPVPRGVTLIIHQVWVFLTPDLICELSVWGLRCSSNSLGCSWPSVCWPVTPPRAIPQAQTGQGTCLCHSARLRSTLPSHTWCQATVPAYTSKNVIICLKINFLLPYLLKEAPCLLCMECHSYSLELQGDWRVLQIHSVPAGGCGSEPEACASLIE